MNQITTSHQNIYKAVKQAMLKKIEIRTLQLFNTDKDPAALINEWIRQDSRKNITSLPFHRLPQASYHIRTLLRKR